ncbi:MAG TPA: amidase [Hypericibacter adhaerens]|uniref:amidase n=1 Tax=Hypericibacter adhaerens TaxID=2602016 RepID=UPI002C0EF58C|nr:amidase [Hypericibacter adhaerens]HWA43060.1 amidase [Hypericibacter adhaerens]
MADLDLCFTPATELAHRIREGRLSPVRVVENSLARIAEVNPKLNCFCFTYPDEAMEKAKQAERAVKRGDKLGLLHGVPIAIKDLTPTKGKRTTLGSYCFENWVPDRNAVIVDKLEAAGAIMVGKTNTPEFAYSSFTESPLWGITRNPWNPARAPGGSSGGSGAAVASGCVPLAEGTDMGGSVRIPAAWCGTVGLKPSLGRIPMDILPSLFDNISHFGPLARTIEDARLFLKVAQGPDDIDIQSIGTPLDLEGPVSTSVEGMRLALNLDLGCYAIDPETERLVRGAVKALEKAGAKVEEVSIPWKRRVADMWVEYWQVFMAAYFGHCLETYRAKMDPLVVALIEAGNKMPAAHYKRLEIERSEMWKGFYPILQKYDAFLCPTMSQAAPPVGRTDNDYYADAGDGLYHGLDMTGQFNLTAPCPALSVPAGWTQEGLPVGLQIVGRRWRDDTALQIGAALERVQPWADKRPPI